MSVGMIVLTALAVLIFFGVLQRVLDRMYLTDRQALAVAAAMFVGTLIPNINLGPVALNIGGAIIPLAICIFLFIKADTGLEKGRTLLGCFLTGAAIFGLSLALPSEPEQLMIEPMWLYAICGGLLAWVLGRSRRGAFICGVLGVMLADTATAVVNWSRGIDQQLVLGGAGVADAVVVSGVLAVLLCELVGEIVERMVRGRRKEGTS
ncbi:MAG: DUF1614 domain-containing protein [Christensenellaceae bacterium]|nr:DUF1614 domain-containing protein [Christensenellaceae bacterium]